MKNSIEHFGSPTENQQTKQISFSLKIEIAVSHVTIPKFNMEPQKW